MRNLRRRIEALQKVVSARRQVSQAISTKALDRLWLQDLELLISAFGADREGRTLSESELAARQAYKEAVERECQWARVRPPHGYEHKIDINNAIIFALALRTSPQDLQLARTAVVGAQQGRAPNEHEEAAFREFMSEHDRLRQLARFDSVEEFERFCSQTEFSTGGPQS